MSSDHLEVRNLKFDIGAETTPRYWHAKGKAVTVFFDALSTLFPLGERFFITSVRAHQSMVTDPRLEAEVKAFCAQEGVHGREHVRYNEMLKANGYPIAEMDARLAKLLGLVQKLPDRTQLAVTCALEHFTALLAHWALGDKRVLEGADPNMAAIWRWHAAEESEHKAVAYDVFQAAKGHYPGRVVVMYLATLIFLAKILEHQVRMMKAAGILWSFREWASLGRFLAFSPGVLTLLVPKYLRYYVPGFHPNDMPCDDLLEDWKKDFEASPVYTQTRAAARAPVHAVAATA